MNRKERRASSGHLSKTADADELLAAAMTHQSNGEFAQAQKLCRAALMRDPAHGPSLVLLGGLVQQEGRNNQAIKLLGQALALDPGDAAAHDNIAMAYQALGRRDEAVRHFTQAIALGLGDVEALAKQSPVVTGMLKRLADAWPRHLRLDELLGPGGVVLLAGEVLLLALLQSKVICDLEFERLLTAVRRALLQEAIAGAPASSDALEFFGALAQQCFINEYVFALDDVERAQSQQIRERVAAALEAGADIVPLDLIVAASYQPLYCLPMASSLLARPWPEAVARLVAQQVREPREEVSDRDAIPALTSVDDAVSRQVQTQYEENPYPRWITVPPVKPGTIDDYLRHKLGVAPPQTVGSTLNPEILIAGCGTGSHSIETARRFPQSPVLAVDISRTSLAYARRKTRELGVGNIEYGQADILRLGSTGRRFDLIEAVGVLHHLADPAEGWRVLLSLLRPGGLMLVGLYSALARRPVNAARTLIAERGLQPTADDIRACRQELIQRAQVPPFSDFFSTSGCRDLLFNVVEHQFTIAQIKTFLNAHYLKFLGFEASAGALQQFRQQFPDAAALADLACWQAFEQARPRSFANMYVFWIQKPAAT